MGEDEIEDQDLEELINEAIRKATNSMEATEPRPKAEPKVIIEVKDEAPVPKISNQQDSIIRALLESLKDVPTLEKEEPTVPGFMAGKTFKLIEDLRNVTFDELGAYLDCSADEESDAGEFLHMLHDAYIAMIEQIDKDTMWLWIPDDPSNCAQREIFNSAVDNLYNYQIEEIVFDLTGESNTEGSVQAIADTVFKGLTERFLKRRDEVITEGSKANFTFAPSEELLDKKIKEFAKLNELRRKTY